jgi:L-threonylcarbamoyladenylate synthase
MQAELTHAEVAGAIERAVRALKEGHLVVFPTDTLYALAADLFNAAAVAKIFQVKSRRRDKGIPVLLSEIEHLNLVAGFVPDGALSLAKRHWPGPLTLILPKRSGLPSILSPNDGIAVRIPDHPLALSFINAAGGAVAATSANLSGKAPLESPHEIRKSIGDSISFILDGGPSVHGQASTILDCRNWPPVVVRRGPIQLPDADNYRADTK